MATIRTSIELTDRITAPLYNIVNALNLTVSSFQDMQGVASQDIDTSSIEAAREQINLATAALHQFGESGRNVHVGANSVIQPLVDPIIPDPLIDTPAPVEVPIQWNTPESMEIVDGGGTQRLTAELELLQNTADRVVDSQRRITETAATIDVLPPDAIADINETNNYIQTLMNKLQSFQDIDVDVLSDMDVTRLNSEIERTRSTLTELLNIQNGITDSMNNADFTGMNNGFNQTNALAERLHQSIRQDTEAIRQMSTIQWNTPESMEIFTNSGIDRFEAEIQSANAMLNTLHRTQQQISNTAAQSNIFPDNMTSDLNSVNDRIQRIQNVIQQIERNPINRVTSSAVNNDIERLRQRLNQAVQQQNQLNQAMQEMDISSANAAYEQLQNTISETEIYLRDNVDSQGQFNRMVQQGQKHTDKLMQSVKRIATAYLSFQTLMKAMDLSDTLALSESRLSLIVDDGGSVQERENKIFASAQRSRANFQDTIDIVSKLGLLAGKAFSSNDEMIAFTELMNKNFIVGGASATEQASAMYQLTQAMASGRLQGDEYRSIIENAPLLAKAIEDYMVNVKGAEGTMKDWASEGLLTADVIKAALFSSADEIEERFNNMPMTFGQIWTSIKNNALLQFQPILRKMNEIANTDEFDKLVAGVTNALGVVASIVSDIFGAVVSVGSFMYDNWSTLEPIIWGIVAAMTAWKIITGLHAISVGMAAAAELGYTGIKGAAIAVTAALTGSTVAATAAQYGMNAALYACPIVWIIAAVIALIVLFVIFTEEIMGAIWWLGALFKNIGLWIANCGIAAWEVIKNIGLWFANLGLSIWTVIKNIGLWFANLGQAVWAVIQNVGLWFANLGLGIWAVIKACASNVGTAFSNAWITVQIGFWSMVDVIMQGLKSIAEKANKYLGWMGVDIDTSGLDFASNKIDELNAKKSDYVDVGDAWAEASNTYAYKDVGDAFSTYDYGSVADAWNTNDIDWSKVGEGFNTFDTFEDGWGSDAYNKGAEVGAGISDWIDNNLSMGAMLDKFGMTTPDGTDAYDSAGFDTSQYLSDIADDTGKISDSVDLSEEDLKYLRDIAERDVVNRFTTAEVKVEFGDIHNNVSSDVDLDGMVTYITDKVAEELEVVAEGVHE